MRATKLIVAVLAFALTAPFFSGCKKGANDPALTIKSRNSRLSADWTLASASITSNYSEQAAMSWDDSDCEDFGGDDFNNTEVWDRSQVFAGNALTIEQDFSSTYDGYFTACGLASRGEYEEGSRWDYEITYSYSLTMKQDGTYDVDLTYSIKDPKNPLPPNNDGNFQGGATFAATTKLTSKWYWVDMANNKEGLVLENFPWIEYDVTPVFEPSNTPGECDFDYRYISDLYVGNTDMTFRIDQLKAKEMILMCDMSDDSDWSRTTDKYEAYDEDFNDIDCIGTEHVHSTGSQVMTFTFTSDGKNVKE